MSWLRHHSDVAAFFDLDGTLIPFPSLERRMFRTLLWRRAIPVRNLAWWAAEVARLAPRGIAVVQQANKMYLRGVSAEVTAAVAERVAGAASLEFLPEAVEMRSKLGSATSHASAG